MSSSTLHTYGLAARNERSLQATDEIETSCGGGLPYRLAENCRPSAKLVWEV